MMIMTVIMLDAVVELDNGKENAADNNNCKGANQIHQSKFPVSNGIN